jgi:hypothetical protein
MIKQQGGMAVIARSWADVDHALQEAGYSGIVAGPLFETPEVRGMEGDKT